MLLSKSVLCIVSVVFIFEGQCISIRPVTLPPICATVLCALPECPNPIPPADGQCCPTCPPSVQPPTICPPDKPLFNCFVDPCMFAKCPAHPNAVCIADYCGGCLATFFIGKKEVTETCHVCKYNRNVYQVGDSFPADDGCNKCTCRPGGIVECTKIFCPDFCVNDCVRYNVGDGFPAGDGCNTCTCQAGGKIACTEIACQCPVKGQVFNQCGSACPANCTTPNPPCTRQCVPRCECPAGQVIDEKKNECVPRNQCPEECPPVCTAAFCSKNNRAKCTMPGPREIPGCTGSCQFTFCSACYFSEEPLSLPGSCETCGSPISSVSCYKRWASCIYKAHAVENEDTAVHTEDNFRCYRYPCQLKG